MAFVSRLTSRLHAFLTHDGVPVGGIAGALMLGTYALLDLPLSVPLLIAACCGAVIVYQLDRVLGGAPEDCHNRPERVQWMRRHRRYVWSTVAGAAGVGLAMGPLLRPATLAAGAALGGVALLHVVLARWPRRHRIRWSVAKPVLISGVWAVGAVALPVLEAGRGLAGGAGALIAYRWGLVLVNTLLADWGDRAGDVRAGRPTWAAGWPRRRVERVSYGLLGALLVGGLGAVAGGAPTLLVVDLGGVLLMGGVVRTVHAAPGWAHHWAVDAVVAWPVVTFLADRLFGLG